MNSYDKNVTLILAGAPIDDVEVLQRLVKRAEQHYLCLRGPRPSGAVLLTKSAGIFNLFVRGDVRPPTNSPSCKDEGECMIEDGHCVRNNHAEVDAILTAAAQGIEISDATCYSINKPCYQCTRALIAAGVSRVIYAFAVYDEKRTNDAAEAAGLEMVLCPIE